MPARRFADRDARGVDIQARHANKGCVNLASVRRFTLGPAPGRTDHPTYSAARRAVHDPGTTRVRTLHEGNSTMLTMLTTTQDLLASAGLSVLDPEAPWRSGLPA